MCAAAPVAFQSQRAQHDMQRLLLTRALSWLVGAAPPLRAMAAAALCALRRAGGGGPASGHGGVALDPVPPQLLVRSRALDV